jgi:hypothetical protein
VTTARRSQAAKALAYDHNGGPRNNDVTVDPVDAEGSADAGGYRKKASRQ